MPELLNEYTPARILIIIQQMTEEYKQKMDEIRDLQARISKSTDPNELIARLSKNDLALVPALHQLIRNPDDKYWHANLLTSVASELFSVGNLWEWLDGEFSDLQHTAQTKIILDKISRIYNPGLLLEIQQKINNTI